MLPYDKGRELIAELDGLRTTIIETIGAKDSELGTELLWEFLDLHPSILERVDDSSGRVGSVFRMACDDIRRPAHGLGVAGKWVNGGEYWPWPTQKPFEEFWEHI